MQDRVFADTNILIYCYSNDEEDKKYLAQATALENDYNILYSEDMQDGLKIDNLQIINPLKR